MSSALLLLVLLTNGLSATKTETEPSPRPEPQSQSPIIEEKKVVVEEKKKVVVEEKKKVVVEEKKVFENIRVPYTSVPCWAETEGTLRWNFDDKQLEVCNGSAWTAVGGGCCEQRNSEDNTTSGCRRALESGSTVSGLYWLKPPGASQPFQAYCDQTTDGGGWMLLYAYSHIGGQKLPLSLGLPIDPNGYSHQLLNNLGIGRGWAKELRFYCTTSAHTRVIHFRTSNANILAAAYDGKKHYTVNDWKTGNVKLAGHSAFLPDATTNLFTTVQSTPGFTDFPFWKGGTYHWGIAPSVGAGRFECDDYPGNVAQTTLHRVFVRE